MSIRTARDLALREDLGAPDLRSSESIPSVHLTRCVGDGTKVGKTEMAAKRHRILIRELCEQIL